MNVHPAPLNPSPRALTDRGVAWLVAGLIAIVTLLAYRGTFSVPFVLDDTQSITDNDSIRTWSTAWWPPKNTTTTGRPVVNLSLALNYAVGGFDVRGYHAFNLAVHVCAALLLFGVVRRTLRTGRVAPPLAENATLIAGSVALLWAVHPLQTESITYTIQRAESLVGLFFLLTLYAFIRGVASSEGGARCPPRAWLVASFAACLLGMATKEVMAAAPLLVLLYDRTFVAKTWREALRPRGRFYAGLAATWLVLAALVISSSGRGGSAGFGTKIPVWDYALTQCHAIVHYLRLAVWPTPLVFDYGVVTVTSLTAVLGPVALLIVLLGGTVFALREQSFATTPAWSGLGFLGACFFAILAPSSSFVPIATQTIAEHRMYLPLAAVITLGVIALYHGLGRRVALIAVALTAACLTVMTSQRNATYRDALALWTDTVAKAPSNTRAYNDLGLALIELGRVAEAQQPFETARHLQPEQAGTHHNLGNALRIANRFDEAIAQLEAAVRLDPDFLEAQNNLGIALTQAGRIPEALPHFKRALQIDPESAETHSNFGFALTQAGRIPEALPHFTEAARLKPNSPRIHDRFGSALLKARRLPEAIAEFETALRLDPGLAGAHNQLGLALTQAGRAPDGLSHLTEAARLAPADAEMKNDLGVALAMAGRIKEAAGQFEEAVRLKPDFAEAERNRARARAQLSAR